MLNEDKRNNILLVLNDDHIQVACISETGLDSKNGTFTSEIKEAGYELIHGHRENKRGGGTAILYRNTLNAKPGKVSSSKYTSFEFSYLTLISDKSKILLICVHRKQEISCNIFCDELESFMEGVYHKGDSVICVGNYNMWVDVNDDKERNLVTLMNAFGLVQLIRFFYMDYLF